MKSIAEEIEKMNNLRETGAISEEEYNKVKTSLLKQRTTTGETLSETIGKVFPNEKTWSMLIHLSQFCGYFLPFAGLIVPITLWQIQKNESRLIDENGKIVANWIITELIFIIVFSFLSFIVIGIPLLFILILLGLIFPVIGGIKANNGEIWPYPLSIKFFAVNEVEPEDGVKIKQNMKAIQETEKNDQTSPEV